MHQTTINHKFNPGDLVTLAAMTETPDPPQTMAVVYVRGDWAKGNTFSVRYYCRAFGMTCQQQIIPGPPATLNGLFLLDEDELVAWEGKPDD